MDTKDTGTHCAIIVPGGMQCCQLVIKRKHQQRFCPFHKPVAPFAETVSPEELNKMAIEWYNTHPEKRCHKETFNDIQNQIKQGPIENIYKKKHVSGAVERLKNKQGPIKSIYKKKPMVNDKAIKRLENKNKILEMTIKHHQDFILSRTAKTV
jgi:hypothetical protein